MKIKKRSIMRSSRYFIYLFCFFSSFLLIASDEESFLSKITRLWTNSQKIITSISFDSALYNGASKILQDEEFFDGCNSNVPRNVIVSAKRYVAVNLAVKALQALTQRSFKVFFVPSVHNTMYGIGAASVLRCLFSNLQETKPMQKIDRLLTKGMASYSLNKDDEYRAFWIPTIETQKICLGEFNLYMGARLIDYVADRKGIHECIHDGVVDLLFNFALHKCVDSYGKSYREREDESCAKFFAQKAYDASIYNPYEQYMIAAGIKLFLTQDDDASKNKCEVMPTITYNVTSLATSTTVRCAMPVVIKQAEKISYFKKITKQIERFPVDFLFVFREISYALITYFLVEKMRHSMSSS